MSLAKGSIAHYVSSTLNLDPDSPEFTSVYRSTLQYILGIKGAFVYQKELKALSIESGISSKTFRMRLLQNKYLFPLKVFTLKLSLDRGLCVETVRQLIADFGLKVSDAKRVLHALREDSSFRVSIRRSARKILQTCDLTMKNMTKVFHSVYQGVVIYVKSITYRKLRFLAKSNNQDLRDLQGELMIKVVQAYHQLMPTEKSESYIGNYLRRAAHNHAMNMIHAGTTKKRGRLINTGKDSKGNDQFSLQVVSENQMNVNKIDDETVAYDELGGGVTPMDTFELTLSVKQLLSKYQGDRKKFRLLTILMGVEHRRFTDWLKSKRLCGTHETNVDVQLRILPKTFIFWAAQFLKIPGEQLVSLVTSIRTDLGNNQENYGVGNSVQAYAA